MANMKSIVCTKANQLVKAGYTKSEAFTKAWALAKIEKIDNQLFSLNMIDRQSASEKEEVRKLNNSRREIAANAGIELKAETMTAAPVEQKIENPYLTAAEKEEIRNKMFNMMTFGFYNGTFDMDEYKALEASLYVTVMQIAA